MRLRSLAILMALVVLAAACGGDTTTDADWLGEAPVWTGAYGDAVESAATGMAAATTLVIVPFRSEAGVDTQALGLRAGAVDDNQAWDDYLLYRNGFLQYGIPVHDVDITGRRIITVTRPDGTPVMGASVTLLDADGATVATDMTRSYGTAMVFPVGDVTGMTVLVVKDGEQAEVALDGDAREHDLTLDAAPTPSPIDLDVLFLIDVTGSMGDEIDRLKQTIDTIAERIDALPAETNLRLAMTVYRDRGDTFVTSTHQFTPDIDAFSDALAEVIADGGGDYPESLNEGLHEAIHLPEWRVTDTVSLIFLVADAPPVLTYAQDYDYAVEMFEAAERGITIHPIASSGLDDEGEYVFRQLAQVTGGRFVFLTYGAGGAPGDDTTHHVDDYSVLSLDDLVVKIVEDTLAPLTGS